MNLNISNFPFHYFLRTEKKNTSINKTIINNIKKQNIYEKQDIFIFHNIPEKKNFYKTFSYLNNKYKLYSNDMNIKQEKKVIKH